ncbi:MAG: phosphotransferase [Chloroflexota bacterium]|nr:phosphotransferase [Chloroflexota bacterium]
MDSQQIPIDDLRSALSAHLTAQSGRYGLHTDTFRLEPFSYNAVEATRSFTARDHNRAVHIKLWHTKQQAIRDCWLAVHDILESRHNAPRVLDRVDLPEVDATGLIFEHIDGLYPTGQAATDRLLRSARRLHEDEELATQLGFSREPTTVGQYFEGLHIRRLNTDINIIRATAPPPIVDDGLLAWMERETQELKQTARSSPAFEVQARWPTHGDLYEGNTLLADDGGWYVFDWDDLALGDPVADYIIILRNSAQRHPEINWRSFGIEATDEGFGERMRFYARVSLLYKVVDGLAEHLGLDASNPLVSAISREKREAFESGLALYRERYG